MRSNYDRKVVTVVWNNLLKEVSIPLRLVSNARSRMALSRIPI